MEQVKQKNAYPSQGMSFADQKGLTKREYFAAMAMQGMFANSHATEMTIKHGADVVDRFVNQAVMAADELLKQLENN
jgi:hypothetical protein